MPARNYKLPPPPAPDRETAQNSCAGPPPGWEPLPHSACARLHPTPSCNKISGEDLLLRGSSVPPSGFCASSTTVTLGGTLVFITSEPRSPPRRTTQAKDLR